jgi:hypothetical protein
MAALLLLLLALVVSHRILAGPRLYVNGVVLPDVSKLNKLMPDINLDPSIRSNLDSSVRSKLLPDNALDPSVRSSASIDHALEVAAVVLLTME